MAQAVSDLSSISAPSRMLWAQIASLHSICGMVSIMMVCVFIQGRLNKSLRVGIYLFAAMNWVSSIGYEMFPLTGKGYVSTFQDNMHILVTAFVVLLSISSLVVIIIGGYKDIHYRSIAIWATFALSLMLIGAIGVGVVPIEYFGIPERFSVFAVTGFNAVLGVYLFNGFRNQRLGSENVSNIK